MVGTNGSDKKEENHLSEFNLVKYFTILTKQLLNF